VSDRRWFKPKVSAEYSAEYSAETEYSVLPAETKSQNSAFLKIQSKTNVQKSMQNHWQIFKYSRGDSDHV
jgi:hypothetical protein